MLRIYHVPGARSVRPIWLCHELGLPVEVVTVDFSPAYRNSAEWRAMSPAGKVPVMTDGDLTMFESGAMVDYILERYGEGRLRPAPGTPESALHHQWCWFSEATLIRPLGVNRLLTHGYAGEDTPMADGKQKVLDCLGVVDQALADRPYLMGSDFAAADIMMGYALGLLAGLKLLDARHPRALAYFEKLRTRAALVRAMAA